jgi:hypothetical protein
LKYKCQHSLQGLLILLKLVILRKYFNRGLQSNIPRETDFITNAVTLKPLTFGLKSTFKGISTSLNSKPSSHSKVSLNWMNLFIPNTSNSLTS